MAVGGGERARAGGQVGPCGSHADLVRVDQHLLAHQHHVILAVAHGRVAYRRSDEAEDCADEEGVRHAGVQQSGWVSACVVARVRCFELPYICAARGRGRRFLLGVPRVLGAVAYLPMGFFWLSFVFMVPVPMYGRGNPVNRQYPGFFSGVLLLLWRVDFFLRFCPCLSAVCLSVRLPSERELHPWMESSDHSRTPCVWRQLSQPARRRGARNQTMEVGALNLALACTSCLWALCGRPQTLTA